MPVGGASCLPRRLSVLVGDGARGVAAVVSKLSLKMPIGRCGLADGMKTVKGQLGELVLYQLDTWQNHWEEERQLRKTLLPDWPLGII